MGRSERFVRPSMLGTPLPRLLKGLLYIAVLFLPGTSVALPLLWWLERRGAQRRAEPSTNLYST